MRNKLLTLLSLFCLALAVNAQDEKTWEAPSPKRATFVDVVENGKQYMIYNVETETFMCNALAWATKTAVSENQANVYLLETEEVFNRATQRPRQGKGGWTIKTMRYIQWKNGEEGNERGGDCPNISGKYVFIDAPNASFQDMGNQGHNYFDLVPQGDGTYRIRAAANDDRYGKGVTDWDYDNNWFGVPLPGEEEELAKYTEVNPNGQEGTHGLTWKFAEPAVYDALCKLYEALEANYAADEENKVEDVEAIVAVYNDEAATVEDIEQAIADLEKAIADKKNAEFLELIEDATDDDPVEITDFVLKNADFSAGNAGGWDMTFQSGVQGTNIGYQGAKYENGDILIEKFIEAWANSDFGGKGYRSLGDGQLSQTLQNMPAGKYMLTVDCIAHQQDHHTTATGVELFCASGEFIEVTTLATGDGKPEHFEVNFLCGGGDLTVGLRTKDATANWIAADNFRLYFKGFIGAEENPYKILLDQVIKSYAKWDIDENSDYYSIKANDQERQAWETALTAAKEAEDNFTEMKEQLIAAAAVFEASIEDYKKLDAAIAKCEKKIEEVGDAFPTVAEDLRTLLTEWKNAYEFEEWGHEDIVGLEDQIAPIVREGVAANMKEGDDVTCLLNNPTFDTDFSGWDITGAGAVWGGLDQGANQIEGGVQPEDIASGNAERWHAAFSVSQTLYNMPAGIFTLSCQAFEREDDGNPRAAVIYAIINEREQNVPVMLIDDDASDEALYNNGAWNGDVERNGQWVPNGMTAANVHFYLGKYKNKFSFILDEPADVTVGIKTESDKNWILFDNFKLIYAGASVEPLREVLENLCEQVSEGMDEFEATTPVEAATTDALTNATELLENEKAAGEDLQAAYKRLSDSYKAYKDNAAALERYRAANTEFSLACDDLADYLKDEEALEKMEEFNDISINELFADYTTAELDTCTKDLKAFIDVLRKWESFQLYIAEEEQWGDNEEGAFLTEGEKYAAVTEDEELKAEYLAAKTANQNEEYPTVTAELDAYKAQLENLIGRMKVWYNYSEAKKRTLPAGWEEASDDNLIEFTDYVLENANLDKGANQGWLWEKNAQNGPNKGDGPIDGSQCMEFWNPTAAGYSFDYYQTIFCLPEGRYMLWVTAFTSKNGEVTEAPAEPVEEEVEEEAADVRAAVEGEGHYNCAKLYAHVVNGSQDKWHATPISVIEDNPSPEMAETGEHDYCVYFDVPAANADAARGVEVTVGVKSSGRMPGRWFVADDFQLIYYGKESSKPLTDSDAIDHVSNATVLSTAVYSINGTRQARLQRGVNIIKTTLADGTVRVAKVLVK